jgi:hypothetical protein
MRFGAVRRTISALQPSNGDEDRADHDTSPS